MEVVIIEGEFNPPIVNMVFPSVGSDVSGTIIMSADATDNRQEDSGMDKVEFYTTNFSSSDKLIGTTNVTSVGDRYEINFDTNNLPNGLSYVYAKAYDKNGNYSLSPYVDFITTNTGDNIPPTVSLDKPISEITYPTQEISIEVAMTDNNKIAKYELYQDYNYNFPIHVEFTDKTLAETSIHFSETGPHSLMARAYDNQANTADSSWVSFNVINSIDITSPTVKFKSPLFNDQALIELANIIAVSAEVSENKEIARVDFLLDQSQQPIKSFTSTPYEFDWDSKSVNNGFHWLVVRAYDTSNNIGEDWVFFMLINPVCQNNKQEEGEECDDGNNIDTDACTNICKDAFCGDAITWSGVEQCDDGNKVIGDGCSIMCEIEVPPVFDTIGDQTVDENQTLQFTVSATDTNTDDSIIYTATNLPAGASFNPVTHVFSWTPTFNQAGTYLGVEFTVTDNSSLSDFETTTISVNDVNRAPYFLSLDTEYVAQTGDNFNLKFSVVDSDKDTFIQSIDLDALPDAKVRDLNVSTADETRWDYTIEWKVKGKYKGQTLPLTIVFTDEHGLESETVDVTISVVKSLPEAICGDSICDTTIGEDCNSCSADCGVCPRGGRLRRRR